MKPTDTSARLRLVAATIDRSKNPSASLVAQDLREILAALTDPESPESVLAEVYEDKSEQLKQLAIAHLSDVDSIRQQAFTSLVKNARNSTWAIDDDPDGASAVLNTSFMVNGIEIPVRIRVDGGIEIAVRGDIEMGYAPPGTEEAGVSESEVDEFGQSYVEQYAAYDWSGILEWLADASGLEDVGKDKLYDHFSEKSEPTRSHYDLRGRG
jgi:hypothetical protein